LYCWSIFHSKC